MIIVWRPHPEVMQELPWGSLDFGTTSGDTYIERNLDGFVLSTYSVFSGLSGCNMFLFSRNDMIEYRYYGNHRIVTYIVSGS